MTPEQLAGIIKYWIANFGTDYQKRLKPLMNDAECLALSKFLCEKLVIYDSNFFVSPGTACIVLPNTVWQVVMSDDNHMEFS